MYVEDATDILHQAAQDESLIGKTLFATHNQHLTVLEIAQKIVEVFGRSKAVHVEWPEERLRIEIERVQISSARLFEITGWQPRYSFEQGLLKTKAIIQGARKE